MPKVASSLLIFVTFVVSACERSQTQPSAQLTRSTATPTPTNAPSTNPTMSNPKAIIIAWVGPSDRPTPPTIIWSDKAALQGATDWITNRGRAPIGVTAVEANADSVPCMAKAIPAQPTGGNLIEVATWDGTVASTPVRLNATDSRAFLTASIGCVGEASPAAGYLKSLQTQVVNAGR